MGKHFNQLTAAEDERLALLLEELGEAIHAIGKIQRHGYQSYNPDDIHGGNNRQMLERELGDIRHAVARMVAWDDIDEEEIVAHATSKAVKVERYLHHQRPNRDRITRMLAIQGVNGEALR